MTETFIPPKRPLAVADDSAWVTSYRAYAFGAAFAAAFFEGLARALGETPLEALVALTLCSALVLYATLDAKLHGKAYDRASAWVFMYTVPVALLVHFVWTRRFRGLLAYLGWGALALLTVLLGFGLGTLIRAL